MIIHRHDRKPWPFSELPDGMTWDFEQEEETRTAVLMVERSKFDFDLLRSTLATLNIISFSGAPPGCVMITSWSLGEVGSGVVRVQVEFTRRRMPFYLRVLPH